MPLCPVSEEDNGSDAEEHEEGKDRLSQSSWPTSEYRIGHSFAGSHTPLSNSMNQMFLLLREEKNSFPELVGSGLALTDPARFDTVTHGMTPLNRL